MPCKSVQNAVFVVLSLILGDVCSSRIEAATDTPSATWQQAELVVDRALEFLSKEQLPNGAFAAPMAGQPGVSALCALAFVSNGHVPGEGPHGEQLVQAVQFILKSQQADGLLSVERPRPPFVVRETSHTCVYNHAIAGFVLAELFGMTSAELHVESSTAIERALHFTYKLQREPKRVADDRGGWRYLYRKPELADSDLSATSWHLLFLRSAKNAGFDVPAGDVRAAVDYVKTCYDSSQGTFFYTGRHWPGFNTRAMATTLWRIGRFGFVGCPT